MEFIKYNKVFGTLIFSFLSCDYIVAESSNIHSASSLGLEIQLPSPTNIEIFIRNVIFWWYDNDSTIGLILFYCFVSAIGLLINEILNFITRSRIEEFVNTLINKNLDSGKQYASIYSKSLAIIESFINLSAIQLFIYIKSNKIWNIVITSYFHLQLIRWYFKFAAPHNLTLSSITIFLMANFISMCFVLRQSIYQKRNYREYFVLLGVGSIIYILRFIICPPDML